MAVGVLFWGGVAVVGEPSVLWRATTVTLVFGFLPLLVAYAINRGRAWSRPLMLVPPAFLALVFANVQVWRAFGLFVALTAFMALYLYRDPAALAYYRGLKAPPRR